MIDAVECGVSEGIIKGYIDEKKLKPNNPLTEAQYLTMIFGTSFLIL